MLTMPRAEGRKNYKVLVRSIKAVAAAGYTSVVL